jgi:L-alanine-DL-glutamate epimerase-like enolase superfamily enzyme
MPRRLSARIENWPIRGVFAIARGTKREAVVVVAEVSSERVTGRGECTPYARYGETPEAVLADVLALSEFIALGGGRAELQTAMPPGAARNALDCALWDYEAKSQGTSVYELAGVSAATACTAYTISLGMPARMEAAAQAARGMPLLKVKLGGGLEDLERIAAVRRGAPHARLIADANEAWTPDIYPALAEACARARVEVIEQPFPADADGVLAHLPRPVPVCADESAFTSADIPRLSALYDAVNVKLDKAGGLTEALRMAEAAAEAGLHIMAGCMVATSLAMAPAMVLASRARWVDLDGPLLLERDRTPGLDYEGAWVSPPRSELWG